MTLTISHNSGFFSCFTFRLNEIIRFFNENKVLPERVDSSRQFRHFKNNLNDDLTEIIFQKNDLEIKFNQNISLSKSIDEEQFSHYNQINFSEINPLIEKYFSIGDIITNRVNYFKSKYNLNLEKTIGVFYRGNDKITETNIGSYDIFLNKIYETLSKNPGYNILIQTDDQDFINFCRNKLPFISFSELITIPNNPKHVVHYFIYNKTHFAIDFFAATKIMSMCKILITHSGNCGLWSVLYRGNTNNVSQYLNHNNNGGVWYDNYN